METLTFILGILTVTTVLVGVSMFMVINQIFKLKNQNRDFENSIGSIYSHTEDLNEGVHQTISNLERNVNDEFNEIYRQLDSRLDKLENKLTSK